MSEGAPEPEPPAGRRAWRNRFGLGGAALLGAAVVGLGWLTLGGGDSRSVSSFQVGSGIPPVVFLYLDNVHIASYLAQLQGGAATSEVLSRQASVTKNASVGSSGVGVGGSTSEQPTAELSLTVNDQSRFTNLLGLLHADGFLHTVDMAARDPEIKREFAAVPDGAFVKLTNCTLSLPYYVQAEEAWRATGGRMGIEALVVGQGPALQYATAIQSAEAAKAQAETRSPRLQFSWRMVSSDAWRSREQSGRSITW